MAYEVCRFKNKHIKAIKKTKNIGTQNAAQNQARKGKDLSFLSILTRKLSSGPCFFSNKYNLNTEKVLASDSSIILLLLSIIRMIG